MIIKIAGAVALLLDECDPGRLKEHLRQENVKLMIYAVCNKITHGALNYYLMACKKLAKNL